MSNIVRVGLIGCGKMGLQHLKAIVSIPGAEVVGIADPAADAEQVRAVTGKDVPIVADAATLFAQCRPQVVHIVTPPHTHAPLASQALAAGCHVYVEKPFTATRAEAEAIIVDARQRGLTVCAGHQCLFDDPSIAALKELKAIGRLVHVESYFSFKTARRTISPVDQAKDILPHAVYPLVAQLRAANSEGDGDFELVAADVRAAGDIYAVVRLGSTTGIVLVTLNGRPVEQYQHLVGTNGMYRVDYIAGSLLRLTGPGTGPGVLFTPYRRAWQTITGATRGFSRLILGRRSTYPGLRTLFAQYYESLVRGTPPPVSPESIIDTVDLCERIGARLDQAEAAAEAAAEARLSREERRLPAIAPERADGGVLVTGGAGLLGRRVVEELRMSGYRVRAVVRRVPRYATRVPGVEYVVANLAAPLAPELFASMNTLVHCAAETAGTKDDHQRNSIDATRHVIEGAASAGIRRIVHVSSLAVLKTGKEHGGPIDEATPLDAGHLNRGAYVWGKAESELVAQRLASERGLTLRIIRPGPLVDYGQFQPPGRLGRELGPYYVAIGGKRTPLSVCDVGTAARVVRSYVQDLEDAPPVVNLVEAPPPTRRELVARLELIRPDLRVRWFPGVLLRLLSPPLRLVQRLVLGAKNPVDVYAAFASESYRTDLAGRVIARATTASPAAAPSDRVA